MKQIAVRLPVGLIAELDAKVDAMRSDPLARAERSALIRVLLAEAIGARKRTKTW